MASIFLGLNDLMCPQNHTRTIGHEDTATANTLRNSWRHNDTAVYILKFYLEWLILTGKLSMHYRLLEASR